MNRWLRLLPVMACAAFFPRFCQAQDPEPYELPPINYSDTKPHDAVTRLQTAVAAGQIKLDGTDRQVVHDLLRVLRVPEATQMLVFSKTSFQKDLIGPRHPRALYFTDDCYVGWVPGGLVEIAAIDPVLGPVFYSFDPRGLSAQNKPEFTRENECLRCHGGTFVPGIPGVFARSLYPDGEGEPIFREGSEVVDDQTPFAERWGGWYVTGQHGTALHRGNQCASEVNDKLVFDPKRGANITRLGSFFNTNDYLAGTSDIMALLVFEYQTSMQNVLTRAGVDCRKMLEYQRSLEQDLHLSRTYTNGDLHFDSVRSVFEHTADNVVDNLLFKDEAPLPRPITGSADFQKAFAAGARRDKNGDSLKDLEISGHLFKNRCSYLIYSDTFQKFPTPLKSRIYDRLAFALNSTKPNPRYGYIGAAERRRIDTILRQTDPVYASHRIPFN